jgi:hypothetical protein
MEWSSDVDQADWIGRRLEPFDAAVVTSVVPGGYEAYARVFHPASHEEGADRTPVRWSEVAAWSGLPLRAESSFPDVALPEIRPAGPLPWSSAPEEGTLDPSYATALIDVLSRSSGSLPWWFCIWDGFGWEYPVLGSGTERRDGPRVRLPNRDYLVYQGSPDDALAFVPSQRQTANLWWPADRSWCVASEIDLQWTYVGASADVIDAVVSHPALEALTIGTNASHWFTVPGWVTARATEAANLVQRDGRAVLETPYGTLHATVTRDDTGQFVLAVGRKALGQPGSGSSRTWSSQPPTQESLIRALSRGVTELLP